MDGNLRVRLGAGIIVAAAAAAGVGLYMLGGERKGDAAGATGTPVEQVVQKAEPAPAQVVDEQSDADYEAFMAWLEEEAAKEEPGAMTEEEPETAAAPVEETPAAEPMPDLGGLFAQVRAQPPGENVPRWRAIWSDLNLTAEERARVRQGFGLAVARWMAMPPEQQAAERARLEQLRVRWEGMDDEERAAASQRMRDRFDEWRASGRVELPELTLD